MLYLLKQPSFTPGMIWYKAGYSKCINKRMDQYDSSSAESIKLATKQGNFLNEQMMHRYLHHLFSGKAIFRRDEWYGYSGPESDIIGAFQKTNTEIEEYLWEHREEALPHDESSGITEVDLKIWTYLKKLYGLSEEIVSSSIDESMMDMVEDKESLSKESFQERKQRTKIYLKKYQEALDLTEKYKSDTQSKIRFSEEMKPVKKTMGEAEMRKCKTLELTINKSFKKGKFYTEENLISTLDQIYKEFGITANPTLENLSIYFTITRVYKDSGVSGLRCKERKFYYKLV